jgi:abhydrolase domain-containing protein 6
MRDTRRIFQRWPSRISGGSCGFRLALITAVLAAAMFAAGFAIYWGSPRTLLAATQSLQRFDAGVALKSIEVGGARIAYLDGGEGEAVVLVHGIYAEKDHWNGVAGRLTGNFRVIIPDLAGFGESEIPAGGTYSYDQQVERLHDFLTALGLQRYHLAGNSMGGAIVGIAAARWPSEVLSVSFIGGAPRVPGAEPSEMELAIAAGEPSPMVVTNTESYFDRFHYLFETMPFIPQPILDLWAARDAADPEKNKRIWAEVGGVHAEDFPRAIPEIDAPAFVLWCDGERVFHVSGAQKLADRLHQANLVILKGCGHLPMLERPGETGNALSSFLLSQEN